MFQKIKNIYHLFKAYIGAFYFGFPSKQIYVIGVTGTDGKTTTVNMIYQILKQAGKKVAMISSVNAQIANKTYDTGFHVTTPDPWQIQKYLKRAINAHQDYFILETTSHGLDQNRVAGVNFKIGVLTNVSHEHLDYHKTWKNYLKAKSKLIKHTPISILNKDDESFKILKSIPKGKIYTYSLEKNSDINKYNYPVKLKIIGKYNISNALAAASVGNVLKIPKNIVLKSLENFEGVSGRMEYVNSGQNFKAIVDFAHTPNSLEQALKTLKSEVKKPKTKLISVFGAAGDRDKKKRPIMGEVAANYSDIVILTAEDPRNESVEDISGQIAKGLIKKGKAENKNYYKINDRKKAIQFAVNLAKQGDIVVFFGKSHEKSMCFGNKEYSWDEFSAVKTAIKNKK